MLLEVRGITVCYDNLEAVKDVSLCVQEGAIVVLIGANGAGKTTVLRAVSGLEKLIAGEIWFRGIRIDGLRPPEIVKLGIAHVPEGRRAFPDMSVLENLKAGAYLRDDKQGIGNDLDRVFELFPILGEKTRQRASSLSGGQQQMLVVGRAFMSRPKLLLLDEPSLGLAPLLVQAIARIIVDLNRSGVSVVLVEQNANLALSIGHKGYVLEVGRVALQDDARNLLNNEHVKKAYLGG